VHLADGRGALPTAAATRLIDPLRTSPAAKTPGRPVCRLVAPVTQMLTQPGVRSTAMAMDAYREGDELVVEFDLPGADPDIGHEVETRIGRALLAGDVEDGAIIRVDVEGEGQLDVTHENPGSVDGG
jgi:hypothetical protein